MKRDLPHVLCLAKFHRVKNKVRERLRDSREIQSVKEK
jgi:hypothetical protein